MYIPYKYAFQYINPHLLLLLTCLCRWCMQLRMKYWLLEGMTSVSRSGTAGLRTMRQYKACGRSRCVGATIVNCTAHITACNVDGAKGKGLQGVY